MRIVFFTIISLALSAMVYKLGANFWWALTPFYLNVFFITCVVIHIAKEKKMERMKYQKYLDEKTRHIKMNKKNKVSVHKRMQIKKTIDEANRNIDKIVAEEKPFQRTKLSTIK